MSGHEPYYRPIRNSGFQPRFTLSLFYLFGLFFLFALVLVIPELIYTYQHLPPGTEEEHLETARDVAKDIVRPRLWFAIAAAVFTTAIGLYFNVLPGLRQPRP